MSLPSSNQSLASTQFASDDRLRTLFESVAAGIVIQSAQGPILYANQMAAEIFGMSRNDVEGRTSFDPKWQMITEAGRPVAGEQHPSMITVRTGRPLRGEIRGIFAGDPDRTRWLMINTDPLRDPDTGDVTEALITFTDVTDRKHAETALRESEQLLNETGRVAQVGGWEHDLRTGRALWTPTLYDIIEIEPGAPIPGPSEHLNYYAPADRARLAEAYQRCIDTGEPFDLELQCHTARGRPLWSRAIGEAVFENGQCVKLRGTFQDISTRKTAENALRESEYRFRQIYENMAVGVARVSLAFRIESANDAYCRMLGYTEDELIGKRLADITHPEALPENLRQQARLGAGEIDHFRMEKRFIHRTGRVVHGILDANLVRNADGKPLYFLGSVLDVTGRKRAEEALLESEKKFRLLFERSPDAHVIFAKGGLQDCNQACLDMLGIANRDELLSRHPGHISPPRQPDGQDSSEKAEQQIALAYANGSHRFEWTCQRPDGELVELDVLLNAITLQGEPAIHAVWRDITDRKRAEAELARHRKHLEELVRERTAELEAAHEKLLRQERLAALGKLTASVSHELRNPLGTIHSSFYALRALLGEPSPDVADVLDRADRNIQRCDRIIEELLDYARNVPPQLVSTNIDDWLTEVLDEVSASTEVTVHRHFTASTDVPIDPDRLQRAVLNLFTNACQALAEQDVPPPALTVETARLSERVELRFIDNGPGIREDQLAHVLEPLVSTKGFGVGLGLSIVKRIAEAHGGGFELRSAPNQGTTAILWLPIPG